MQCRRRLGIGHRGCNRVPHYEPTPGTAVRLVSSSTPSAAIVLSALPTNGGTVYVGGANVLATAGSESGTPLTPGQPMVIAVRDIYILWIDVDLSGDGVVWNTLQ